MTRQTSKQESAECLTEAPPMPKGLSALARVEWGRMAPLAIRTGVFTELDVPALCLLCESLADERRLRALLEREAATSETAAGGRKAHPALKAVADARAQAHRLLVDLGMTPRSRRGRQPINARGRQGLNPFTELRRRGKAK